MVGRLTEDAAEKRGSEHVAEFLCVKGFGNDIEAAEVKDLRPNVFVYAARGNDQYGCHRRCLNILQDVEPRTIRQIALADDNGNMAPA
jgi:hypothetical protein